jgi:hypothetical protein
VLVLLPSFIWLVGTRDSRTQSARACKPAWIAAFGSQDLDFRTSIFGSQDLGFRTSIFGSQDLGFRTSINRHWVSEPWQTHKSSRSYGCRSMLGPVSYLFPVTFLCVQWSQTDAGTQPRHFTLRPVVTDAHTDATSDFIYKITDTGFFYMFSETKWVKWVMYCTLERLQRCSVCEPAKCLSHPSLVIYFFFATPPIELKLGERPPTIMMSQSETRRNSHIIFITLFSAVQCTGDCCAFYQPPQTVQLFLTKTIFLSQTGFFAVFFIQLYCA